MRKFRFAPSPTGLLHIGGARTAFFNYLAAYKTGGQLLLRIEDTDKERSAPANIQAILDGLKWLGIAHEPPVYQSRNADRHREVAHELVDRDRAYHKDGAIRLKVSPLLTHVAVKDEIHGMVRCPGQDIDDYVILRSDNTPTYMLASVVDDHDMGVTDIIRGDDHLTNSLRQSLIYAAMQWDMPRLAHMPLLHGTDGGKLSKRHGALGIDEYRKMGYLPEVMLNYFSMLGWREAGNAILTKQELAEQFDIKSVAKSPARMDFAKLKDLNARAMRESGGAVIAAHALAFGRFNLMENGEYMLRLGRAMPDLQQKVRDLVELLDWADYLRVDKPVFEDKAVELLAKPGVQDMLQDLTERLSMICADDWNTDELQAVVEDFANKTNRKLKDVAQPIRAALTGRLKSHGVYSILYALGRDESIARLRNAAERKDF